MTQINRDLECVHHGDRAAMTFRPCHSKCRFTVQVAHEIGFVLPTATQTIDGIWLEYVLPFFCTI